MPDSPKFALVTFAVYAVILYNVNSVLWKFVFIAFVVFRLFRTDFGKRALATIPRDIAWVFCNLDQRLVIPSSFLSLWAPSFNGDVLGARFSFSELKIRLSEVWNYWFRWNRQFDACSVGIGRFMKSFWIRFVRTHHSICRTDTMAFGGIETMSVFSCVSGEKAPEQVGSDRDWNRAPIDLRTTEQTLQPICQSLRGKLILSSFDLNVTWSLITIEVRKLESLDQTIPFLTTKHWVNDKT